MSPPLAGLPGHPPVLWRKPGGGGGGGEDPLVAFVLPYAHIWWEETSVVTADEWQPRHGTFPLRKNADHTVNIDTETEWNGKRVVHLSAPHYSDCWAPGRDVWPQPSLGIATAFELWHVVQSVVPGSQMLLLLGSSGGNMNLYDYGNSLSFFSGVGATAATYPASTVPVGSRKLFRFVRESGRAALWQNGTLMSDTVQPWIDGAEFTQLGISHEEESYQAEIAITSRLPDELAGQFSEYLMNKWGLV